MNLDDPAKSHLPDVTLKLLDIYKEKQASGYVDRQSPFGCCDCCRREC